MLGNYSSGVLWVDFYGFSAVFIYLFIFYKGVEMI